MKRKLLSLAAALLCAVSIWADTVDCTSKMSNAQGDWTNATNTYGDGVERYNGNTTPFSTGEVLYQTINELSNGYYLVSFYAWENYANWEETDAIAYGDNIAQVFANTSVQDINVIKSKGDRDWDAANTYTLLATVTDGTLRYGVKNIASGGNWAVCRAISLTYLGTCNTYLGSSDNADCTSLILNPSFETGNMTGWTTLREGNVVNPGTLSDCGVRAVESYPLTNSDGDYIMNYFGWSWSWNANINGIQQTIPDLPAGKYRIEAVLGGWTNWDMALIVNNETPQTKTMTAGDTGVSFSVDITLASATNLTITARTMHTDNNAWEACFMKADNFKLYNLDHYYDALNAAIAAAEEKTIGFEAGEYAPYNNVAAITALNAAKAVNQANYDISWSDLETIVSNLTSATWTANVAEVNAFYKGDFTGYAEDNETPLDYTPAGWTASENMRLMLKNAVTYPGLADASATTAMMSWSGGITYGETTGYELPLKANTIYRLQFKAAGWNNESRSGINVSILNSTDGMALYNLGTPDRDIEGNEVNTAGMTAYDVVFATGAAGNYVFHIQSGNNMVLTDFSITKATNQYLEFADNSSMPTFAAGTYPEVTMTRTINAGNWSTFCVPFDMSSDEISDQLGEGTEVKELTGATLKGDNYTLTFSEASSIVAGKPYMVKVPSKVTSISLTGKSVSSTITPTTVDGVTFTGTYTYGNAPRGSFIISNNVFYQVNSDVTLKAFRGYITVDGASVKALNFGFDDDATGINAIDNGQLTIDDAVIYNVAGQRISKLQKGINIVNGKKILK